MFRITAFFIVILRAKPEGSHGFQQYTTIITVRGILPCLPAGRADAQNDNFSDVILRLCRRIPWLSVIINNYRCGWDSSLPTGRQG